MNILNGGKHTENQTTWREIVIVADGVANL